MHCPPRSTLFPYTTLFRSDQLGMIEHQCGMWPPFYLVKGPFGMKIWNETDPVTGNTIALKIDAWEDKALQTIWMDGRSEEQRLNSSHMSISYAVFCLKKKN